MRTALELLKLLRELKVAVKVVDGKLSLKAAKGVLTAELREELSARKSELIALVSAVQTERSEQPLTPASRDGDLPLSFAQQRLWFLQRLLPTESNYNHGRAWSLQGSLDVDALSTALTALVVRHEVLRTTFPERDGTPVQLIAAAADVSLPVTDLSGLAADAREAEARRQIQALVNRPYELANEQPMRAVLFRLDEQRHVLCVVTHHIATDGWSMSVFNRELAALYAACLSGMDAQAAAASLPALPVQVADHAAWQRETLRDEALEEPLAYWRRKLDGVAPLDLATDRTRPPQQTFAGDRETASWPAETKGALDALASAAGATPFTVLLAAFQVLLQRTSGQDDISVGTPVGSRERVELEGLLGCFLNMLALRSDLSGDPAFEQLLGQLTGTVQEGFAHQGVPFERVVEDFGAQRDLSRNPLFQVFFTVHNTPRQPLAMQGLEVSEFDFERQHTNFDLDVHVWYAEAGVEVAFVKVAFVYNTDLFDGPSVRGMLDAYRVLIEGILADPGAKLSSLPLLSEAEQRGRLEAAADTGSAADSGTDAAAPEAQRLPELFAQQVARTPDAPAVSFAGESLSYEELDRRSDQLAQHLRGLGVGPAVPVGLCVERGFGMLVGTLGILKAGGAYVPLASTLPADRMAYMLADTAAPVLVTESACEPSAQVFEGRVVRLDDNPAGNGDGDERASADDPAYVIYTSGSTGKPKGVAVPHSALVNFLRSMAREPGLTSDDVLLAVTTLSFDIAGLELFLPLIVGARVEIASSTQVADGLALARLAQSSGATVCQATPATWQMLIHAGWEGDGRLKMLCGGEALPRPLANQLLERGGQLWNMYGPTETTVWSATTRVERGEAGSGPGPAHGPMHEQAVPIGHAIDNTQLLILDEQLRPVPQGVPGELHIAGAGLAIGYVNLPELTAERFVPSPWPDLVPGRLYKTGDRVREDAHGQLQFLGRLDTQVKLRGYRIEIGEIEAVLLQHPAVDHAAVVLAEDAAGEQRLAAYLVAAEGTPPSDADLRTHLRQSLPDYMLPSVFTTLSALPLSTAGKVDRKQLAAIRLEPVAPTTSSRPPRGPEEEAIAAAFCEVMRLERVGVDDDFFELGGHSLLATRLVSRVRDVLDVEIPLEAVFESGSVAQLALIAKDLRAAGQALRLPPLTPVSRERPIPLSFTQRRLWFLSQMETGAAYHMQHALGIRGALDQALLTRSLDRIVERHEALRSRFEARDGTPCQVVLDPAPMPLRCAAQGGRSLDDWAAEEAAQPFALERGEIIRALLVSRSPEDHTLILTVHHIAADVWALRLLAQEVAAGFRDGLGAESSSPELTIQVPDYAAWQNSPAFEAPLEEQFDYWRSALAGELPVLSLPTDRPRPAVATFRGGCERMAVDADLTGALMSVAQHHRVTLAMLLLSSFQDLLSRYTGVTDVLVGSPIANRTRAELEPLVGCFVNSLVLRSDLSGDPTLTDVLARVRRTCLDAYAHQDLPFERLVDELDAVRDPSRSPLFQVVFAMQNTPDDTLHCPGLDLHVQPLGVTAARHDLELYVVERDGGLAAQFVYNSDLFDAATIERLAKHYRNLLASIAAQPEARLSELSLLDEGEQRQIVQEFNSPPDAATDAQTWECVHHQFEELAASQPDTPALLYGDTTLSYRELNEHANRLAHALRERGVGPDVLVGLHVERGPDMVVCMLGVLKAGGAYLPMDPAYPAERIAFMVTDSAVPVLVTREALHAALPEAAAAALNEVLCLDRDAGRIDASPADNPTRVVDGRNLAYAIYTSGSTGVPKAALLEHAGLANLSEQQAREFGIRPGCRVLQFASFSFDAATFEIVMALPKGGTLVLGTREELLPGKDLGRFLKRHAIEVVTLPPTALATLDDAQLPALKTITVAGEACPRDIVKRWAPGRRFFNLYGPTEATVWTTFAQLQAGDEPHIGRPVGNTQSYVLDRFGKLAPINVPGEMHIGGVCLARGYHRRPELTAERFIEADVTGSGTGAQRLYRTGDLARFRPDGNLEFLGRIDHQVKLRGHRIELGEIEAVLDEDPSVRQSVVMVREDVPGEPRLVAYVATDTSDAVDTPDGMPEASDTDHVAQWQELYEETYSDEAYSTALSADGLEDPTFNISGWQSSTGEDIPADEMREWLECTVSSVLATKPKRVLELGCGAGLLLFRIAPHCEEYRGTDFSQAALDYVQEQLPRVDLGDARVVLDQRTADDLSGIEAGHYDTIILNSVVQYFPDADYLAKVLKQAVRMLAPGGRVFVGDVRSLPLLDAFHTSVQLAAAEPELPLDRLAQRVRQQRARDQELVVHPDFFVALRGQLGKIQRVSITPKPGRYDNELSRYRYDVVLALDEARELGPEPELSSWPEEGLTLESTRQRLKDVRPERLGLRRIPNRRTLADVTATEQLDGAGDDALAATATGAATADELRATAAERCAAVNAVDPEELSALARELDYNCSLSWAAGRPDGSFDAVLTRADLDTQGADPWGSLALPPLVDGTPDWSQFTNRPLQARLLRHLVPRLRARATSRLPDTMLPSAYVLLDELPVTPNGKIDRRALPAPESLREDLGGDYQAPTSNVEEQLAEVWQRVLDLDRVGVNDNFFELGGDSILGLHLVAAAREIGVGISAKDLFQYQTIAELAQVAGGSTAVAAEQGAVIGEVPLTPIQHWFFELQLADAAHFNQALLLECDFPIEAAHLREALAALLTHHDQLRARFLPDGDGWRQEIAAPGDGKASEPWLTVVDLTHTPSGQRQEAVRREADRVQTGFHLSHGPLFGAALFEADDEEHPRLLLAAHHLVVDAVSWRPLLDDLQQALAQLRAGEPVALPAKTTSFRDWGERLAEHAAAPETQMQAQAWLQLPWHEARPLPRDHAPAATGSGTDDERGPSVGTMGVVSVELDEAATHTLLHELQGALDARIEEALLTALARCVAVWAGSSLVPVDLEGFGRDADLDGVDLSRTVGWFTSIHPVALRVRAADDATSSLRQVADQLRAIPDRGLAFGLVRALGDDPVLSAALARIPHPEIAFNYLGQLDRTLGAGTALRVLHEPKLQSRGAANRRAHGLEVNASVADGRLGVRWAYDTTAHDERTLRHLADSFLDELRQLASACSGGSEAGFGWSQDDMEDILAEIDENS